MTKTMPWRLLWLGVLVGAILLSGCVLPFSQQPAAATPVTTAAPQQPPATGATPTFVGLPPTYTPMPSPMWTPTALPQTGGEGGSTPVAPTATPTGMSVSVPLTGGRVFAGVCSFASDPNAPCLYSVGFSMYQGKQVIRYVFENIPHPDSAFVEINGVSLECMALPQYPTRAYCIGNPPARFPIQLRLGWYAQGSRVEVRVPQSAVDAVAERHMFPVGKVLLPTPTARPAAPTPYP